MIGSVLTKEKIAELITPLLPRSEYAFYHYTILSIVDFRQDTNRSDQPAPGTEDIEMQAPPTSTAEVAAILFAEMEKHTTNGQHINYYPWYIISFCDVASTRPPPHPADEGHPDTDDVDALPVCYKKGSRKPGERIAFLVRD